MPPKALKRKLRLPVPDHMCRDIYALPPAFFTGRGIRFLLLDVDNTLAPYGDESAPPRLVAWVEALKAAGLSLFILSNNRGNRPAIFAEKLGIPFVGRAKKPATSVLTSVLAARGFSPAETALVGDQIYTDVLCARCAGILAVLVRPISLKNPLLALRYGSEAPFRGIFLWRHGL